jgi:2-methylisocitrate lyase-like PEP mutase family enzyme
MATQSEKAERFKALHARPGAFVFPNPWDAGYVCLLDHTLSTPDLNGYMRND